MAVPTFVSCTPSLIFTGGQLVTIAGTNFRTAYTPPDVDGAVPTPPPTVAVTFNGKAARRVCVVSATLLTCLAPATEAGDAVIVVENLDQDGNPIAGESVTTPDGPAAAAFARADLSVADDLERVTRALLRLLKREVIPNVVETMSTDYSGDVDRIEFNITETAELPCVAVSGPTLKRNKFYGEAAEVEQRGTDHVRRRYLRTSDLTFKVAAFDNSTMRVLRLQALITKVMENNTYFEVLRDASDESKGSVFYELDAGDFGMSGAPNKDDVRSVSGEITLRGFTFEDVAGFPDSMVASKGASVDNVEVTTVAKAPS